MAMGQEMVDNFQLLTVALADSLQESGYLSLYNHKELTSQTHGTEPWDLIVSNTLSRDFIQDETRHLTHGRMTNEGVFF